jgi:hypothetical protein
VNVVIVLAFSRIQNAEKLIATVEASKIGLTGTLTLVPVCDTIEQVLCFKDCQFAEPILAFKRTDRFMAHWLLNVAMDQLFPLPAPIDTIFSVFTDDDAYWDGYYRSLEVEFEKHNRPMVMVTSMRRWFHGPNVVDHLTADAAHMKVCQAGFEMIYLRGDIAQHYRFADNPIADGFLIEQLHKEFANQFVYLPNLMTEWNRFQ